jgi:hypothetical protein
LVGVWSHLINDLPQSASKNWMFKSRVSIGCWKISYKANPRFFGRKSGNHGFSIEFSTFFFLVYVQTTPPLINRLSR